MKYVYIIEQMLFLLPTILSLFAAVLCLNAFPMHRREEDRDILMLGGLGALMLFTIHITVLVKHFHNTEAIGVFHILWVMYNSIVMFALIIFARPRKKDSNNA